MLKYFFLLLILHTSLYAEQCTTCKKEIPLNANILKNTNGDLFCSKACAQKSLPPCIVCGKKSPTYLKHDDKVFCSKACTEKVAPRCIVCNQSLAGKNYLKNDTGEFCSQKCFLTTMPKCQLCADATMEMLRINGIVFCAKCYRLTKCDACSLPSKGSIMPDGREICGSCQMSGIKDNATAQKIYIEIKRLLEKKFKLETTKNLPLSLIDRDELKKLKGHLNNKELGFYRQTGVHLEKELLDKNGGVEQVQIYDEIKDRHIYILSYLPENHFKSVVAHELMHNWVANNYPKITDTKITEGLSEYVASLIDKEYNEEILIKMKEENKDSVYGDGYRMINSWDQGQGIDDIKKKLEALYPKQN